jgi:hypothetical protein
VLTSEAVRNHYKHLAKSMEAALDQLAVGAA